MKYVFDATSYSHLLRGHDSVATKVKEADQILLPNVVVAELLYGFRLGKRREENERLLSRFIANKKVAVILPDNATTDYFVNIAVFARKNGVELSSHDIWIAALSEQWGVTLLTFDNDFKHLGYKDLKLILEH